MGISFGENSDFRNFERRFGETGSGNTGSGKTRSGRSQSGNGGSRLHEQELSRGRNRANLSPESGQVNRPAGIVTKPEQKKKESEKTES
jgi:hypothetical protein